MQPVSFPRTVTLETSAVCNLRCRYCCIPEVSRGRNAKFIDMDLARRVLAECARFGSYVWLDFMGEPTLHPEFPAILECMSRLGLRGGLESNATIWSPDVARVLAESVLSRIIVTVEPTPELFAEHRRGGDLAEVEAGLRRFLDHRPGTTPVLELQLICAKHNTGLDGMFQDLATHIGVDRAFTKPIMFHRFANDADYLERMSEAYWALDTPGRYVRSSAGVQLSSAALATPCPKLTETVILSDGRVVMCCYDKDGQFVLGDLHEQSLQQIWAASSLMREDTMRHRRTPLCRHCLVGDIEDLFSEVPQ